MAIDDSNSDIILAIPDVVLQVHAIGITLNQNIELFDGLIDLSTLTIIHYQNYQISSQSLLYLFNLVLMNEISWIDV